MVYGMLMRDNPPLLLFYIIGPLSKVLEVISELNPFRVKQVLISTLISQFSSRTIPIFKKFLTISPSVTCSRSRSSNYLDHLWLTTSTSRTMWITSSQLPRVYPDNDEHLETWTPHRCLSSFPSTEILHEHTHTIHHQYKHQHQGLPSQDHFLSLILIRFIRLEVYCGGVFSHLSSLTVSIPVFSSYN